MRELDSLKLYEFLRIFKNVKGLKNKAEVIRAIQDEFECSIGPGAAPSERAIHAWFSEKKLTRPPRKLTVELLTNLFTIDDNDAYYSRIIKELQILDINTEHLKSLEVNELVFQMSQIVLGAYINRTEYTNTASQSNTTESSEVPHYLTQLPLYTDRHNFLFREKETDFIIETIRSSRIPILICGMGGIGKTSLARFLFYKLENDYDIVGWVTNLGGLENSLLTYVDMYQDSISNQERLKKVKEFLRDNPKKKLLIIDDADETMFEDSLLYQIASWRNLTLIVTSRVEEAEGFLSVPVNELSDDECRTFFYHYYDLNKHASEKNVVDKIIQYSGNHSLTLELIAKGAKYKTRLDSFYQQIEEIGINTINRPLSSAKRKSLLIEEHLRDLYDLSTLSQEEKRVLHNLAKFPSVDIPIEIVEWINTSESIFEKLIRLGWLAFHSKGYYMHPIIKNIVSMDECISEEFDAMMKTIGNNKEVNSLYCIEDAKEIKDFKLEIVLHFIHDVKYDASEKVKGWMNLILFYATDYYYLEEQAKQIADFYEKEGIVDKEIHINILNLQATAALNLQKLETIEQNILLLEEYLQTMPETALDIITSMLVPIIVFYEKSNLIEKCNKYVRKLFQITQNYNPLTFHDYTAYLQSINMMSAFYIRRRLWDNVENVIQAVLGKELPVEVKKTVIYGVFCHNISKFYTDREPWEEAHDHISIEYELKALDLFKLSCDDNHQFCVTAEKRIREYHSKYFPDTNYEEWIEEKKKSFE
ncbi:MAG: hypothetical protein KBT01_02325 [Clostridiales bacterium]|nr:hypothetical protein [Candidatus Blautia equi]